MAPVLIHSFIQPTPTSTYSVPGAEGTEGPKMNHSPCRQGLHNHHSIGQPGSLVTSSGNPSLIALLQEYLRDIVGPVHHFK